MKYHTIKFLIRIQLATNETLRRLILLDQYPNAIGYENQGGSDASDCSAFSVVSLGGMENKIANKNPSSESKGEEIIHDATCNREPYRVQR